MFTTPHLGTPIALTFHDPVQRVKGGRAVQLALDDTDRTESNVAMDSRPSHNLMTRMGYPISMIKDSTDETKGVFQ